MLAFAEVVEQHQTAAGLRLGERAHGVQLVALDIQLLSGGFFLQAAAQPGHVGRIVQQDGFGRQAVRSGAAGLLIIGFDIARDIEMHHEAHVGFIDAHAEGDGGHHHLQIVTLERFLHLRAAIVVQPGVVGADAQPAALQTRSGVFHLGAAVAIDNAALAALILHEAPQLIERLEFSTSV